MRSKHVLTICGLLALVVCALGGGSIEFAPAEGRQAQNKSEDQYRQRENGYRANNLGIALLEQFKYKEAAAEFSRALEIFPRLGIARINLAIALYYVPDLAAAERSARESVAADPSAPQPHYIAGLVARSENRIPEAITEFGKVLRVDPDDVGSNVNIGQLYLQQRKYTDAVAAFRKAVAKEPYNATALYNLATTLLRTGDRSEGQRLIERFRKLRERGGATTIGASYLEQGHYAEAVVSTGAEPDLVDRATPNISFSDATPEMLRSQPKEDTTDLFSGLSLGRVLQRGEITDSKRQELAAEIGGNVTLFDYDGDGYLDMFVVSAAGQKLYHNEQGKFVDVTAQSGALAANVPGVAIGAVAGDYDNDGKPDIFVFRYGGLALYHNDGGGKFSDVTRSAGIPQYPFLPSSAAFVDFDHDGHLDIFVAGLADLTKFQSTAGEVRFPVDFGRASNLLLRNNANGTFADVTSDAKVNASSGHAVAVVPTDYDNNRAVDLLVVNYGSAPNLFSNERDGTFRDVAAETGLAKEEKWTCVAAGDLNKDGFTDFFFGVADGPGVFAISDGKGRFNSLAAPPGTEGARAAQILDYDNDGLLDVVVVSDTGLHLLRNVGDGWIDVTTQAASEFKGLGKFLGSADLLNNGDTDLVVGFETSMKIARNSGGDQNHSVRVNLKGRVSNKSAVGAKIEARSGSLIQKLEVYAACPAPASSDILFGLGKRAVPDAIRILWPAGIVQAETEFKVASARQSRSIAPHQSLVLPVTELDRKPSSCPYLYTWNGHKFEFITDFMGAGEVGYLESPGRYNVPYPEEYVRIRGDQLKEEHGHYELRITNELEETMYLDRVQLIAVAHPSGVEIYPRAGMVDPPWPGSKIYVTRGAHPPLSAEDDDGRDVLPLVSSLDRRYPDGFSLDSIRGYAGEHTLTMKLDNAAKNSRTLLLLTGWTDYAWSSDNVAASHSGKSLSPPALEVKDAAGNWRRVIENIGIPIGRPQTVTVDLTGKFLTDNREVRIVTNMRIYWDQILVDTSSGLAPFQTTRMDAIAADLHWRGFSRQITPDGREPFSYDYREVSSESPWKVMTGSYTREGDVRELLLKSDDLFVVSRPGDEISLSFEAKRLPGLPPNWTRTFLLFADGFSKEMDINSASPDEVAPFPFHRMKSYPYQPSEAYFSDKVRRDYVEKYNTRRARTQVPRLLAGQ